MLVEEMDEFIPLIVLIELWVYWYIQIHYIAHFKHVWVFFFLYTAYISIKLLKKISCYTFKLLLQYLFPKPSFKLDVTRVSERQKNKTS